MKRLLLNNVLLVGLAIGFSFANGSLHNVIHFPPLQSFFTRLDYFWMFVGGLVFTVFNYIIVRRNIESQPNDSIKKVLSYELLILYVVAIPYLVVMIYISFFTVNIYEYWMYPSIPELSVIYMVEILFIVFQVKRIQKRMKNERLI